MSDKLPVTRLELEDVSSAEMKLRERDPNRREMQLRTTEFKTREDGEVPIIEGYFAVFNSKYQMTPTMSESIAPGAFSSSMGNDVRALVNHNTDLVLGRTVAHTLELRQDEHGLYGTVRINPKDTDAMNLYERVKRGDVSECSFGFEIVSERTDISDDGSVHWTIEDLTLYEVSACTFPAYQSTNISARQRDYDEIIERQKEVRDRQLNEWRENMKERLKHGIKTVDAAQEG